MWGGRFGAKPGEILQAINASIDVDKRLWAEDIEGSRAHAAMLAKQGIISKDDAAAILKGLDQIADEIARGDFAFRQELEDIHMHVESRLKEIIGDAGGRLHTARSRNDQVAVDFRLWVKRALQQADSQLHALILALVEKAEKHADWIMPGFTHLQTAQPITLGHHLLAYIEMFERDADRLQNAAALAQTQCPLGAAALAGTPYPIDRTATAAALGFAEPAPNSLDAVSSRDFALEALAGLSIAITHLSRLAEEVVLWTSPQFGFASLSDAWSTGSSIMPQKRNPDVAELARGKSGRVFGHLMGLLTLMKGQPLTYNKDNQEDKEPLFDTVDTLADCLDLMADLVSNGLAPVPARMREAAREGYATATDLADYLVRKGLPFRDAHEAVARAVRAASDQGKELADLTLTELQAFAVEIGSDVFAVLTLEGSVAARRHFGGAAPDAVREAVIRARQRMAA